jgi:hypothetical protein
MPHSRLPENGTPVSSNPAGLAASSFAFDGDAAKLERELRESGLRW